MKNNEKGISLISLIVMIVVILIITGITLGSISNNDGIIEEVKTTTQSAQRESIIEKIEADLYTEKIKAGKSLTKEELKVLIKEKGYAYESNINEEEFITRIGNYTIEYTEIIGWE